MSVSPEDFIKQLHLSGMRCVGVDKYLLALVCCSAVLNEADDSRMFGRIPAEVRLRIPDVRFAYAPSLFVTSNQDAVNGRLLNSEF